MDPITFPQMIINGTISISDVLQAQLETLRE